MTIFHCYRRLLSLSTQEYSNKLRRLLSKMRGMAVGFQDTESHCPVPNNSDFVLLI